MHDGSEEEPEGESGGVVADGRREEGVHDGGDRGDEGEVRDGPVRPLAVRGAFESAEEDELQGVGKDASESAGESEVGPSGHPECGGEGERLMRLPPQRRFRIDRGPGIAYPSRKGGNPG